MGFKCSTSLFLSLSHMLAVLLREYSASLPKMEVLENHLLLPAQEEFIQIVV